MINLIRADLYKMRKSSVIKILFGITTLSAIIMTLMAYFIEQGKIPSAYTGIGFLLGDINMISILGAVAAGVFISGDFDNKIIHQTIASGSSRLNVIISKAISLISVVFIMLLPYAIIVGIALSTGCQFNMGAVSVGFLNILTKEAGIDFTVSIFFKMIITMFTLMLVYMAQLSICIPFAILLKKPVLVVAIYYGFTILCAQLNGLRNSSQIFDTIYTYLPFGGKYTLVAFDTGTGDIIRAIAVSVVFIILMIALTYSIFRKTEIK